MRTVAGVVELKVTYGQDPGDSHWGCPVRELWGLTSHQQLSLALEDKLAFTITATSSYEEAAALAQKWGVPVTDSALHSLTRRLGSRAEAQTQEQLKTPPVEREPRRAPTKLGVLMLDGWQVRQRGPGWGKKKTQQNRVEWHEWKTGVYYRHEQSAHTAGGRGMIDDKVVIGWQGEPVEFARRLHWEGQRAGLGRAQAKLVVGDGAPWIWNVAQDRWAGADGTAGLLSCQPTPVGCGAGSAWGPGGRHGSVGRTSPPPTTARTRETNAGRVGRIESASRRSGQSSLTRTEVFCLPFREDELPHHPPSRLANRLRCRRVGMPPKTMPLQTPRTVLDIQRHAPSQLTNRSPPQPPLG